jgi:hypothetical protein
MAIEIEGPGFETRCTHRLRVVIRDEDRGVVCAVHSAIIEEVPAARSRSEVRVVSLAVLAAEDATGKYLALA